jgi:hypothetical protein
MSEDKEVDAEIDQVFLVAQKILDKAETRAFTRLKRLNEDYGSLDEERFVQTELLALLAAKQIIHHRKEESLLEAARK